jgi:hypothetical protein
MFLQNRRMIAFRVLLGLLRSIIQRRLRSARKMQKFGRLNAEISQGGRKLRLFFVKIDELSRFGRCWACIEV